MPITTAAHSSCPKWRAASTGSAWSTPIVRTKPVSSVRCIARPSNWPAAPCNCWSCSADNTAMDGGPEKSLNPAFVCRLETTKTPDKPVTPFFRRARGLSYGRCPADPCAPASDRQRETLMKAVVFHDIGDIRLEDVPEPEVQASTDAVIRITASAICGTDLHFVRGTVGGMRKGTILGHEAVGIVEALGSDVRNLSIGDRVVVPST